jgi:hypothetical protein
MTTKVEHVNNAYIEMRISGLTKQPSPEDVSLGIDRLEDIAAELFSRSVCFGYKFEDTPDPNSPSGVQRKHKRAIETALAMNLLASFGKTPHPSLVTDAGKYMASLVADTAIVREVLPSRRMPIGSGNNRYNFYQRFYRTGEQVPPDCESNIMFKDDVGDFIEHFDAYLDDGETVVSYTLEADNGLFIVSQSLATPDILYRVRADGSTTGVNQFLQVKIIATTSAGRVQTRVINFEIVDPDNGSNA